MAITYITFIMHQLEYTMSIIVKTKIVNNVLS